MFGGVILIYVNCLKLAEFIFIKPPPHLTNFCLIKKSRFSTKLPAILTQEGYFGLPIFGYTNNLQKLKIVPYLLYLMKI